MTAGDSGSAELSAMINAGPAVLGESSSDHLKTPAGGDDTVLITGLSADGQRLLVIPLNVVLADFSPDDSTWAEDDGDAEDEDQEDPEVADNTKPNAIASTFEWLSSAEPDLLEHFGNDDDGVGFTDYDPVPWLNPKDRDAIFLELRGRGYRLHNAPDLASDYLYPPADPQRWLLSLEQTFSRCG